ncbi:MAG: hypothetical protein ACFE96_00525, partial [Candidatus Hermodarchaeota archaeon]
AEDGWVDGVERLKSGYKIVKVKPINKKPIANSFKSLFKHIIFTKGSELRKISIGLSIRTLSNSSIFCSLCILVILISFWYIPLTLS